MSLGDECSRFAARIRDLYLSRDEEFEGRKAAEMLVRLVDAFRIIFDRKTSAGQRPLIEMDRLTLADIEALSRSNQN